MNLIKTSFLNAIAVAIKMLTLLGINKLLAIYVGPAGYAAIGQFQNAIQMITTFASGAINTGVTKYTAEYGEERQRVIWRTAGTIALIGSLLTSLIIIACREYLAVWFLNDKAFSGVFLWFAITLVFFVFNTLLLAILNGRKEIYRYVVANISGSIIALVVTWIMTVKLGLYGALIALAIFQSLSFFVTFFLCYRAKWFKLSYLVGGIDKSAAKGLAKYTVMALTTAVCVPVSHILIRSHLSETLGLEAAGYWEAMWRLSAAYLMLVTTTLGVYYLPRLSELSCAGAIRKEIVLGYKIIFPVAMVCGLMIYIMRDFIITLLFSNEFLAMESLFAWQMIGDTLKIASWLLGYIITAKAFVYVYVFSEIFFAGSFYLLVRILVGEYGLEATSYAHALNYALHFIFMYVVLKIKRVL